MPTYRSPTPSPPPAKRRSKRGFARKCERCCWIVVTHMPLGFVYGLTTWAVWVEGTLSLQWITKSWKGYIALALGAVFYILLNWSYTTAVFTDPGSPLSPISAATKNGYGHLPTHEPATNPELPSFTVKSTGGTRFCKKCQARKPDRAHHCSTCRRCVLKMDHHCPWLATCVGMRNYKPFLLFCIYTTVFCWVCFLVSGAFLWTNIVENVTRFDEGFAAVNMVLLCVLSGILGLVLAGFTGWHLSLAAKGQTTIECLEKTRYLSPLRKGMQGLQQGLQQVGSEGGVVQRYGQQLAEIHANALPGVTRLEEGEERPSPVGDLEHGLTAREALQMSYDELERSRERQRYEEYLDEKDSEKLPNAFDLGWRKNLGGLFGEKPILWFFPICNTLGDGWHWEPSPKWLEAREQIRHEREEQWKEQERREEQAGWGRQRLQVQANGPDNERHYLSASNLPARGTRSPGKADKILGRTPGQYVDGNFEESESRPGSGMSMRTLRRKASFEERGEDEEYEPSSDEEEEEENGQGGTWYGAGGERGRAGAGGRGRGGNDEWRSWD